MGQIRRYDFEKRGSQVEGEVVGWWSPPGVSEQFMTIGGIFKSQKRNVLELPFGRIHRFMQRGTVLNSISQHTPNLHWFRWKKCRSFGVKLGSWNMDVTKNHVLWNFIGIIDYFNYLNLEKEEITTRSLGASSKLELCATTHWYIGLIWRTGLK